MITQELIDYVKTQLSVGVAREKITSDLLGQGGWTMELINEAFQYAEQSIPAQMSPQVTVSSFAQAPVTIKYFEWLMYASFLASIGIWMFQFGSAGFQVYMLVSFALPIIGILLKFFCVYKVVHHRAEWARIVLVVLLTFNALSIFGLFFYAILNPIFLVAALPIILEIAAIYFVFQAPSNSWLATNTSTQEHDTNIVDNKKWSKIIPRLNNSFMVISAILVFGLDLAILTQSPELAPFFFAMLAVLTIFVFFYLYENRKLKQKFSNSDSRLDSWFVALVVIRDVVFVLNFIPFIQLLGGSALIIGGIPYLFIYYFLIRARNKSVVAV